MTNSAEPIDSGAATAALGAVSAIDTSNTEAVANVLAFADAAAQDMANACAQGTCDVDSVVGAADAMISATSNFVPEVVTTTEDGEEVNEEEAQAAAVEALEALRANEELVN